MEMEIKGDLIENQAIQGFIFPEGGLFASSK